MGPNMPDMPATPAPTPVAPPPNMSSSQVQAAADSQKNKFYGADQGRVSTMLTGGQGVATPSTTVRLLGNVGK